VGAHDFSAGRVYVRREENIVNDVFLFGFGLFVTILSVGPLIYAAFRDVNEKNK
jgi:hypothetical protein